MNDTCHTGRRGRAISTVANRHSRGLTSHVQIEDRGRAITHRRDVLAPSEIEFRASVSVRAMMCMCTSEA